jgi:hypothetical protein
MVVVPTGTFALAGMPVVVAAVNAAQAVMLP